jgi:hypothetical protein
VFERFSPEDFSAEKLKTMSDDELRALLASDSLLTSYSDESNDLIFRITDILISRENKTEEQREAERVEFWAGLIARYGDEIPIKLEDVLRPRENNAYDKKHEGRTAINKNPMRFNFRTHRTFKRLATAAVLAAAILICNTIAAFAFNFNFLRTVIDFTNDLFIQTTLPAETTARTPNPPAPAHTDTSAERSEFQEALDEFGIIRPRAPAKLPDGFEFEIVQTTEQQDYVRVLAQYRDGNKTVVFSVRSYSSISDTRTVYTEKNPGEPVVYSYAGVDFYLFKNVEATVATWTDGMTACNIHGDISEEEIKTIINLMYTEE